MNLTREKRSRWPPVCHLRAFAIREIAKEFHGALFSAKSPTDWPLLFFHKRTKWKQKKKNKKKMAASIGRLKGSHAASSLKSNHSWKASSKVAWLFWYVWNVFQFLHCAIDLLITPLKVLCLLFSLSSFLLLLPCLVIVVSPFWILMCWMHKIIFTLSFWSTLKWLVLVLTILQFAQTSNWL